MHCYLPDRPSARGTDSKSLNSTYEIPLKRRVLLQTMSLTSRTLPTLEKKSSTSRARTRWLSCMQKIVLASRSSGVSGRSGEPLRTLRMWNSLLVPPKIFLCHWKIFSQKILISNSPRMGEMGPRFTLFLSLSRPPDLSRLLRSRLRRLSLLRERRRLPSLSRLRLRL